MLDRIANEPVLVTTLIGAIVTALCQFGLPINEGHADAINAVVIALLAVYARSRVTPTS